MISLKALPAEEPDSQLVSTEAHFVQLSIIDRYQLK